jgi:DNA repair protein RecO (recombination protein O)
LLGSFALKLLAIMGYRPELARCLRCRESIALGAYRWSALRGGVVCDACRARDPEGWFASRPMPDEVLKLLRFALSEPFDNHLNLHLPGNTLLDFHEAVESLLIAHFPTIPANSLRAASMSV